jgi:hypothetical protein
MHMLKVQNQAKQATHFGPPISIRFFKEQPFSNTGRQAKK